MGNPLAPMVPLQAMGQTSGKNDQTGATDSGDSKPITKQPSGADVFSAFEDLVTNDLNAQQNSIVGNEIAFGRQPGNGQQQGADVGNPFGSSPPRKNNNNNNQQQQMLPAQQQQFKNPFGGMPNNGMPNNNMPNAFGQQQQQMPPAPRQQQQMPPRGGMMPPRGPQGMFNQQGFNQMPPQQRQQHPQQPQQQ